MLLKNLYFRTPGKLKKEKETEKGVDEKWKKN
jgi:hypothetical protein